MHKKSTQFKYLSVFIFILSLTVNNAVAIFGSVFDDTLDEPVIPDLLEHDFLSDAERSVVEPPSKKRRKLNDGDQKVTEKGNENDTHNESDLDIFLDLDLNPDDPGLDETFGLNTFQLEKDFDKEGAVGRRSPEVMDSETQSHKQKAPTLQGTFDTDHLMELPTELVLEILSYLSNRELYVLAKAYGVNVLKTQGSMGIEEASQDLLHCTPYIIPHRLFRILNDVYFSKARGVWYVSSRKRARRVSSALR